MKSYYGCLRRIINEESGWVANSKNEKGSGVNDLAWGFDMELVFERVEQLQAKYSLDEWSLMC